MARLPKIIAPFPAVVEVGDGIYRLAKPEPVLGDGDTWVSVREAARLLGFKGKRANRLVYPLFDDGTLRCRRIARRWIQVSVRSIKKFIEARAAKAAGGAVKKGARRKV